MKCWGVIHTKHTECFWLEVIVDPETYEFQLEHHGVCVGPYDSVEQLKWSLSHALLDFAHTVAFPDGSKHLFPDSDAAQDD